MGEAASSLISAGRHPPCNGVDWDAVSVRTTAKNCVADALHLFLRFATGFNEFRENDQRGPVLMFVVSSGFLVRRPGIWCAYGWDSRDTRIMN